MKPRAVMAGLFVATASLAIAACSPGGEAADPAQSTDAAASTATPIAVPAAAAPADPAAKLFGGVLGRSEVPAALLPQLTADTERFWARCGNVLAAEVFGADGKSEGFIVAPGVAFSVSNNSGAFAYKRGVLNRVRIRLYSINHQRYFREGVTRTDSGGGTITKAGWVDEKLKTAPLPFWVAEQTADGWTAAFRSDAPDAAQYARYRAANCKAEPFRRFAWFHFID